jgi:hypothetical protein
MDITVTSISDRFVQLKMHNVHFSFLYDMHGLYRKDYDNKLKFCKNMEDKLQDSARRGMDICAVDLFEELELIKYFLQLRPLSSFRIYCHVLRVVRDC